MRDAIFTKKDFVGSLSFQIKRTLNMDKNKLGHYVYAILDPTKPLKKTILGVYFPYEPIYIGEGQLNRYKYHGNRKDQHYVNHVKHIYEAGLEPIPKVLKDNMPSKTKAVEFQDDLITHFGFSFEDGILANKRIGMGGVSFHSEETKQLYSQQRQGEKNSFYGKEHSPETKAFISKSNKGRKHTKAAREKMSRDRKGKTQSPEHVALRVEAHLGATRSDETKAKISKIHKGKVLSPEHRAKIAHYWKGRTRSPEEVEKRRKTYAEMPEEKRKAIYKKVWETRRKNQNK